MGAYRVSTTYILALRDKREGIMLFAPRLLSCLLFLLAAVAASVLHNEEIEDQFLAIPSSDQARAHLQFLTSHEHMAGTKGDLVMANFVHQKFLSYGLRSVIEPMPALLSFPQENERSGLELIDASNKTVLFRAALAEKILIEDPTSDTWLRNHTYLGYSPSGELTAPVVYANFGRPEDFDALEELGVDVKGKIVLVRYGKCFRGLKAMNAEARGAIATLIYSDPEQDGYGQGKTYPDGPWRPSFGVQRGSAQFLSRCAGDPSRAASPLSTYELCGYELEELIPQYPVLPLSYADAEPLLQSLGGPEASEDFQGGLDLTYRTGPTTEGKLVHVTTKNRMVESPIWNVIATIPSRHYGREEDRVVVLGNHRDAWVQGAADPESGTSALIEVARGYGHLLKSGWVPERTIILGSWSGEELGLIGSTGWGEANAKMLSSKAVAYLNCDTAVTGVFFKAAASASLSTLLRSVADKVEDPTSGGRPMSKRWSGDVDVLGSGSDYTVFIHRLGIASMDISSSISREAPYGVYHSIYDSFAWMEMYGDPRFEKHKMMASFWGLVALRMADSKVLPFDHVEQGGAIERYIKDLLKLLKAKEATSKVDLSLLEGAGKLFQDAAQVIGHEISLVESISMDSSSSHGNLRSSSFGPTNITTTRRYSNLNDRLAFTERRFLSKKGLPERKWFKHQLQAPGLYLGYDAETFPGITQAINDAHWVLAQEQVLVAADRIKEAALFLAGVSITDQ